ncbi:MAG: T9SS type A sorting domain-containing protein [Chitinophagaceae bacterium]
MDIEKQLVSKNNSTIKTNAASINSNDIQLYPNPVQNKLFVSIKNPQFNNITIKIFNNLGQVLQQQLFTT